MKRTEGVPLRWHQVMLGLWLGVVTSAWAQSPQVPPAEPAEPSHAAPAVSEAAEPFVSSEDSLAAANLVTRAREHAAADRHQAAVRDYLAALDLDIRLVETIAEGIAYQRLWREDAERAIFYFRRHMIRNPDADNREVRQGLALALSWSGRQREAIALYRQLLTENPTDGAPRIGLGRSLIWNNNLRSGFDTVREVEISFPASMEEGRESARFLLQVLDDATPPWEFRADWSHDSDELDIWRLTVAGAAELKPSLLLLFIPAWTHYRQPAFAEIEAWRLGAALITPLAHNWALHAYGWYELFRSRENIFGEGSRNSWHQPGTDIWFTWLPTPRLRTDFGGNVLPIETVPSLTREITASTANASLDWRFRHQWSLGVAGQASRYSDQNERLYGTARLQWHREGRVEVAVAPVFTYLDFKEPYPGNGYWSPSWMRNASLEAVLQSRWDRWTLRAEGRLGREKELGSESITVGGLTLRLGWRFSPRALLAVAGGYSESRLASPSGYRRHYLSLALRAFF